MRAAAGEAGNRPLDWSNAGKIPFAFRALIEKTARAGTNKKWKRMTALLVANSQITASLPPFWPVRQNSLPADPEMGQEMRDLVEQCPFDFSRVVVELWI
jgi:hypothetical protein